MYKFLLRASYGRDSREKLTQETHAKDLRERPARKPTAGTHASDSRKRPKRKTHQRHTGDHERRAIRESYQKMQKCSNLLCFFGDLYGRSPGSFPLCSLSLNGRIPGCLPLCSLSLNCRIPGSLRLCSFSLIDRIPGSLRLCSLFLMAGSQEAIGSAAIFVSQRVDVV